MVVDRQKVKTSSESRRYKVADRLEFKAGGYRVQKQARVKTVRTRKRRIAKAGEWEKMLLDLEHTKRTGTERQETQG
jgi:hypothetical protein